MSCTSDGATGILARILMVLGEDFFERGMRPMWYWRDGSLACAHDDPDWTSKMKAIYERLADPEYKILKQETFPDGRFLSTVWLGLDHNYSGGPPLIFETMLFEKNSAESLDMRRYASEAEAWIGHDAMKKAWLNS